MTLVILEKNDIAIYSQRIVTKKDINNEDITTIEKKYIIKQWQKFSINSPGIYAITGGNGSGKSVLIKYLTGALPQNMRMVRRGGKHTDEITVVYDVPCRINTIISARNNGLVAIYQDDNLIPTLTAIEHLYLSCITRVGFRNVAEGILNSLPIVSLLYQLSSKGLKYRILKDTEEKKIRSAAENNLAKYFPGVDSSILDKLPRELSGGQKAIIKILAAQLYPKLKILILDEAFTGLSYGNWKSILTGLKKWQNDCQSCLIAVTHSEDELIEWNPKKVFTINDGNIAEESGISVHTRNRGVHIEAPKLIENVDKLEEIMPSGACIIIDDNISNKGVVNDWIKLIKQRNKIIYISGEEDAKNQMVAMSIVEEILAEGRLFNEGIIVGGGALLNIGGFIMSILRRGHVELTYVPTTYTAVSDVIIGSKTAANYISSSIGIYRKNILGTYHNANKAYICRNVFASLNKTEETCGLIECLKHGIMRNSDLYSRVISRLFNGGTNIDDSLEISRITAHDKMQILMLDPSEKYAGMILQYGHVFAHALEEITRFKLHHTIAVLLGMLAELSIIDKGRDDTFKMLSEMRSVVDKTGCGEYTIKRDVFIRRLHESGRVDKGVMKIIDIAKIGEYGSSGNDIKTISIDVKDALDIVITKEVWRNYVKVI